MSRRTRKHDRAFAAVLAMLLLATSAAAVIASARSTADSALIGRLAVDSARARLAARGGETLALSADRGGYEPADISVDPALGVISFEETSDQGVTQWLIRVSSGDAETTRVYTPQ